LLTALFFILLMEVLSMFTSSCMLGLQQLLHFQVELVKCFAVNAVAIILVV